MIVAGENLIERDGKWYVITVLYDTETGQTIDVEEDEVSPQVAEDIINEYLDENSSIS